MSALSLAAYATGLPAFIAVKVLAPGYYARQDTKTPVKIAITAMVSNMLLNFLFVGTLVAMEFKGPHTGLALASSAAAYINAILLYRGLRRQGVYRPEPGWSRVTGAVVLGSLAMVAVLLWQYGDIHQWVEASAIARTFHLTTLIGFSMLVYGLVIIVGGLRKHHLVKGAS
jgi:putative peptidoglycan lipid II flippase